MSVSRGGRVLYAVARDAVDAVAQKGVDARGFLPAVDGDAQMLEKLSVLAFFGLSDDFRFKGIFLTVKDVLVHVQKLVVGFNEFVCVHLLMMNFWLMTWPSSVTMLRK